MSNLETKPAVQQAQNHPQQKPKFSVAITTKGYQSLIRNTLGDEKRANRFIANITSAVAVNPNLQDCDAGSILAGGLLGESLGLLPSPQLGQFYLVPFECRVKGPDGKAIMCLNQDGSPMKDKYGKTVYLTEKKATFVVGYKGLIQMALRSGVYADMDAIEVHEGEYKGRDKLTAKPMFSFIEDDDERDAAPIVGYMSYLEMTNGFRKVIYWTKKKMIEHADTYSAAFSKSAYEKIQNGEIPERDMWKYSSFWYKDFNEMAKKTMLRQIITKWGVMSSELVDAFNNDGSVIEVGSDNELIGTPESVLELAAPDAVEVVPKVNLDEF